ncbi:hypothetical protein HK102_006887 [Quaeritorhiza haematococci]|nr:hypothetical protein HK102_006887 [Quaeritorhiza haematococci]
MLASCRRAASVFARAPLVRASPTPAFSSAFVLASRRSYATRKYTSDHEWVSVTDGVGTIGITEYAQKALGDVVYIEVSAQGKTVEKKDPIGAVESVKAASDVYAPISGEVVEANAELDSQPSLVNTSPYEKGWIAKIKISKPEEIDALMDEAAYAKHTSE